MRKLEEPTPNNPHPLVIFAGSAAGDFANKIAKYADMPLGEARCGPFANGECMVHAKTNVRDRDVFVVQPVCRRWSAEHGFTGVNDSLMELLVWGDTLCLGSAHRITAVIPTFPYARQDRKAASRTPITARLVADIIEVAGFNRVLTMDLHADQIQGFFDRRECKLDQLNTGELFSKHFAEVENAVVLSPDVGNLKKADKYRTGLPAGVDIAVIDKRRDPISGDVEIKGLIGSVEGKTVILLDDIISTAGTMRSAIDYAIEKGAVDFRIGAAHGEFIGPAIERLKHPKITEIAITDAIPVLPEIIEQLPITILSAAELFGEAIGRIHRGESISELLGDFG